MTMRVGAVLLIMLWVGCALAQDRQFRLIGTSGKRYSAIAKRLQIWVEDGVVHGLAEFIFKMHQEDLWCGSFISLDARMGLALPPPIFALLSPINQ